VSAKFSTENGPIQRLIAFLGRRRLLFKKQPNKGQFSAALLAMVAVSMIWHMPPADVSKLMFRLLDVAEEGRLAGYVVSVVSLLGWFFHARYQRKLITQEMQRISNERNQLQARELGKRVKSSEGLK
jgi:hypothetical protein